MTYKSLLVHVDHARHADARVGEFTRRSQFVEAEQGARAVRVRRTEHQHRVMAFEHRTRKRFHAGVRELAVAAEQGIERAGKVACLQARRFDQIRIRRQPGGKAVERARSRREAHRVARRAIA